MNLRSLVIAVFAGLPITSSTVTTYCGQYDTATSVNGRYTYSTDVWGGYAYGVQCIYFESDVETADNTTWLTSTWTWMENATDVHSFANVQLNSDVLPVQVSALGKLLLNVSYTIAPGNERATISDVQGIVDIETRCDVVLDTFLDTNASLATSAAEGSVEVMVWLAAYGGMSPTGNQTAHSLLLAGTTFNLFEGLGPTSQTVYSWYPSQNMSSFDEDVSPMFEYLANVNLISDSFYLGLVQFGTETEHTDNYQNVTWASQIMLDISKNDVESSSATSVIVTSQLHTTTIPTQTTASTAYSSTKVPQSSLVSEISASALLIVAATSSASESSSVTPSASLPASSTTVTSSAMPSSSKSSTVVPSSAAAVSTATITSTESVASAIAAATTHTPSSAAYISCGRVSLFIMLFATAFLLL